MAKGKTKEQKKAEKEFIDQLVYEVEDFGDFQFMANPATEQAKKDKLASRTIARFLDLVQNETSAEEAALSASDDIVYISKTVEDPKEMDR